MASKALISIVIPVYNRAKIVGKTLDSVAAQSLRPLNVILVDNASTDNTIDVLNEWKDKNEASDFSITITREQTHGAAAARNCGLNLVDTPYVLFFDSDDLMSPSLTQRAVDCFIANPNADIVGWDVSIKFLNGSTRTYRFLTNDILYNHIFHAILSTQRYALRTSFIRKVGGWDSSLIGWNDYELGIRLLLHQPQISYLGKGSVVSVISQKDSITGTRFSQTPQRWEKALDKVSETLAQNGQDKMLKYIDLRRIILSGLYAREGAHDESIRLLGEVMSHTTNHYYRTILKLFHIFVSHGGRGVAQIAKILMP